MYKCQFLFCQNGFTDITALSDCGTYTSSYIAVFVGECDTLGLALYATLISVGVSLISSSDEASDCFFTFVNIK